MNPCSLDSFWRQNPLSWEILGSTLVTNVGDIASTLGEHLAGHTKKQNVLYQRQTMIKSQTLLTLPLILKPDQENHWTVETLNQKNIYYLWLMKVIKYTKCKLLMADSKIKKSSLGSNVILKCLTLTKPA